VLRLLFDTHKADMVFLSESHAFATSHWKSLRQTHQHLDLIGTHTREGPLDAAKASGSAIVFDTRRVRVSFKASSAARDTAEYVLASIDPVATLDDGSPFPPFDAAALYLHPVKTKQQAALARTVLDKLMGDSGSAVLAGGDLNANPDSDFSANYNALTEADPDYDLLLTPEPTHRNTRNNAVNESAALDHFVHHAARLARARLLPIGDASVVPLSAREWDGDHHVVRISYELGGATWTTPTGPLPPTRARFRPDFRTPATQQQILDYCSSAGRIVRRTMCGKGNVPLTMHELYLALCKAGRGALPTKRIGPRTPPREPPLRKLTGPSLVKHANGDLFSSTEALAHCVSRDLRMARGIATIFKRSFGGVPALAAQRAEVGDVCFLQREGRHIYYLVTKRSYWMKPSMRSLRNSFRSMIAHMQTNGVTAVSIPEIGCGLDGLTFHRPDRPRASTVLRMIHEEVAGTGITVTVYHHVRPGSIGFPADHYDIPDLTTPPLAQPVAPAHEPPNGPDINTDHLSLDDIAAAARTRLLLSNDDAAERPPSAQEETLAPLRAALAATDPNAAVLPPPQEEKIRGLAMSSARLILGSKDKHSNSHFALRVTDPVTGATNLVWEDDRKAQIFVDNVVERHARPVNELHPCRTEKDPPAFTPDDFLKDFAPKSTSPPIAPVTLTELRAAIARQKTGKCADSHDVHAEHFRLVLEDETLLLVVADCINHILGDPANIPAHFRDALVSMPPKAHRQPGDLKDHRPVSVTAVACRLIESIIRQRIIDIVGPKLCRSQYGFTASLPPSLVCTSISAAISKAHASPQRQNKYAIDRKEHVHLFTEQQKKEKTQIPRTSSVVRASRTREPYARSRSLPGRPRLLLGLLHCGTHRSAS